MLNLVVLDVLDHSWPTPRDFQRNSAPHSGYPVVARRSSCYGRNHFPSLRPSFPIPPFSPHTILLRSFYFTTSSRASITSTSRTERTRSCGGSYGRALGSLRAPGDIRNIVAIILPFDLTSCISLESTSTCYDPPPSYATRIRTALSTV